jgi:hypothetical protein
MKYTINNEIERIISLGNWCSTKANINLFMDPDCHWNKTQVGKADLFDWMCMGDYKYLINALNNNLKDIFSKEDLIFLENVYTPLGQPVLVNAIYNSKYKMIWPHLFDNIPNFKLDLNIINSETLDETINKIKYLTDKFIKAKDYNTLYIITYDDHEYVPEIIRPLKPTINTVILLRDALTKIRDNDTDFILLFLSNNQPFKIFENIILCNNLDSSSFYNNTFSTTLEQILSLLKINK